MLHSYLAKIFGVFILLNLYLPSALAIQVVSVHDGDTLTLEDGRKIRLFGIDAPEITQPYGKTARDALKSLVLNKDISLNCFDWSYSRRVCSASINGLDVQKKLVLRGLAYDYTHYSHGLYKNEEALAKEKSLGVWAMRDGGERPWKYRYRIRQQEKQRN